MDTMIDLSPAGFYPRRQMAEGGSSPVDPISILLVDDRREDLLALEVILEGPGVRLVKASSGAEGLRCVLREDFAVILLDVSMPGMQGFEVAELIKHRERSRHIPIIFLTAESKDVESIYRGYEVGAVDYIVKPIDRYTVRAKVSVFVELHRRGAEIRRQAELLQAAERERREVELAELKRATERRYRNLAEAIPQSVWTTLPNGDATYFNDRWVHHTGFSCAQSLGQGWQSVLHPNDVERFVEQWRRALAAGEPLRAECRLRSSMGSYTWHLCEVLPERDKDGRLLGWLGTFTDVNEQKQLEEERERVLAREQRARAAAEESLRRLEFLAEASSLLTRSLDTQGILKGLVDLCTPRLSSWCVASVIDADGTVEQAAFAHEDEALRALGGELGRPHETAPGVLGVLAGGQPEVCPAPCDPARLAAALGAPRPEVVGLLGAAAYVSVPLCARGQVLGTMTLVSARASRAYGPADVALAVDLGQRAALAIDNARLYANAQRAVRLRDEFLSIASHELRTPLSALELQAQSVQVQLGKQPVDLARINAKATVMQRQVERLSRLINEMLDVSRIEAGRLELDREDVDLAELVHDVAGRFTGELERASSRLEIQIQDSVTGRWDRLRVDQIVTNLLQNAIKYGQSGPIRISLRREEDGAILEVTDHGIGISPADQRRIFERFERAVSARQYGGMGVGLFIVDQIVRAHGGRVDVRSAPGEGATFAVRLPLGAEPPREESLPGASSGALP
jgi:PAS domain S-box-containing protein